MIDVSSLKGLTQDSREVQEGYLFAAFEGEQSDGRDFIPQAISNGAKYVLAAEGTADIEGAELITDKNPRKAFAHLVAEFYPDQPETIVAVTGTNGKTSVVNFVEQIWNYLVYDDLWQNLNRKVASIGTIDGKMTTADPLSLHKNLTKLKADGITHLAMEASSHGLQQYRMDGVRIKSAAFTNLSRDHLDYHENMDAYLKAKSRLFTDLLEPEGIAIINIDSDKGQLLKDSIKQKVWTYGRNGKDFEIQSMTPTPNGYKCQVNILGDEGIFNIPLVGEFQIYNAICALALVLSIHDCNVGLATQALEHLKGVRGRLENVVGHPSGAAIYVDYAHTPDALENVLKALRPHTENRLICIFGCGGDRDKGKRPEMGEIASSLSDQVIVTDDNPRSEDPSSIRADILKGAPSATEIADRRDAIHQTIQTLKSGDVLVIAGKGHEQGQIFADRTDPFDDVTEAKAAIKNL